MTKDKVIEILKNEANCVKAAEYCTRECNKCSLVKEAKDILTALTIAINTVEKRRISDVQKSTET